MKRLLPLVLLAACGESTVPITVYAPYLAAPAPFTVQPGATALFFDADGTLVDRRVTGADGFVTGHGAAGGSVTVVPPPGVTDSWYTWLDVAPEDHLYAQPVYVPPTNATQSVILPFVSEDDAYLVSAVGLTGGSVMPPASGTIVVTAELAADAPAQGDLVASEAPMTAAPRFIVARGAHLTGAPIDLSSAVWSDPAGIDREVDNLPADATDPFAAYAMLAGGRALWSGPAVASPMGTALAMHFDTPGPLGDGSALTLTYSRMQQVWRASFNEPDPRIDLSTVVPPDATNVQVTGTQVTWQVMGDPKRAVATSLAMNFGAGEQAWFVIQPSDRRTFSLPHLPADITPFPMVTSAAVTLVGTNDPDGYAAVRNDPSAFEPENYGQTIPATPGIYRIGGR